MAQISKFRKLDKSIPVPLYYQLKNFILNEIKSGNFALGERIPTEKELHTTLGISQATIRHALSELVQEGWLERKKSKGTFVTHPSDSKNIIRSFEPFNQRVKMYGKIPRTEVIELNIIKANHTLAESMNINIGDKIISMFRRRFSDEEPIVTIQNYLPFSLCEFVLDHDFKTESLYEVLMQNSSSRIEKTTTIITSEKATTKDVKLLDVEINLPMLIFNTISITAEKKIVDFAYAHYRGDLNRFKIESSPDNYR